MTEEEINDMLRIVSDDKLVAEALKLTSCMLPSMTPEETRNYYFRIGWQKAAIFMAKILSNNAFRATMIESLKEARDPCSTFPQPKS